MFGMNATGSNSATRKTIEKNPGARQSPGPEVRECRFSPPGARHAATTYKGRIVEVSVLQRKSSETSHIVVVVHGAALGAIGQTIEYVTDDADAAQALAAGFDIARAAVDENLA
jgi:hypothetical protein